MIETSAVFQLHFVVEHIEIGFTINIELFTRWFNFIFFKNIFRSIQILHNGRSFPLIVRVYVLLNCDCLWRCQFKFEKKKLNFRIKKAVLRISKYFAANTCARHHHTCYYYRLFSCRNFHCSVSFSSHFQKVPCTRHILFSALLWNL